MYRVVSLALGFFLLTLPATAQQMPKNQPDIVITGQLDAQIDAQVRRLAPSRNGRQIARWDGRDRLCVTVIGLWPERAAFLSQRIGAAAGMVGVQFTTNPKCVPNVFVVFTPEADKVAADLIKHHPELIQNVDMFGLPHGKLKAGYLAPRAVRWFSVDETTMADGELSNDSAAIPTRIKEPTRENIVLSLLLVDESKLAGIKWPQLGDYLAMTILSQPKIDADYGGDDSVLSIFAARDAGKHGPAGLTEQDKSFLTALYRSDAAGFVDQQRQQISNGLREGLPDVGK